MPHLRENGVFVEIVDDNDNTVLVLAKSATNGYNPDGTPIVPGGGGGSGTSLKISVSQNAHGFTVGVLTPVRYNAAGSAWVKSKGDTLDNAEVHGIAVAVNVNAFDLYLPGSDIPTSGATAGIQYLDPAFAGAFTAVKPSTPGTIFKTVGVYVSPTVFLFAPMASEYIAASPYMKQILGDTVAVTVADIGFFVMPSDLDGATCRSAEIFVSTGPTTNAIEVNVKNNGGTTIFSTKPKIATAKRSNTEAGGTAAVISAADAVVTAGHRWTVAGTIADAGTAADRGLTVLLRF